MFGAGVYSEHGEYDSLFLSNYIDLYVADSLKRVKGVADVFNFAPRKYSMRLWLDPTRLASRGITATDVVSALSEQNVQVAAGANRSAARAQWADVSDQRARRRATHRAFGIRKYHFENGHAMERSCASKTWAARNWALKLTTRTCASMATTRSASA